MSYLELKYTLKRAYKGLAQSIFGKKVNELTLEEKRKVLDRVYRTYKPPVLDKFRFHDIYRSIFFRELKEVGLIFES